MVCECKECNDFGYIKYGNHIIACHKCGDNNGIEATSIKYKQQLNSLVPLLIGGVLSMINVIVLTQVLSNILYG